MIHAVLLDVDGTLVLSNDAQARSWVEAFAQFGYDVPFDRVRYLIGMGSETLIPKVVPGLSKENSPGKEIAARRAEIFKSTYLPTIESAPGSRALVERMKNDGLRIEVATSSPADELQPLLKVARIDDLVEKKTDASDVSTAKPAPDVVDQAMQKIGMPPKEVTMLGDTPYDIESAGKAKVGVIAVRCGGFPDEALRGALAVYDDPADLLAHYDESPLRWMADG